MKNQRRLFVISLGCPKNLVDTETMLGSLMPQGYRLEDDPRRADTILINTCSFIEPARQETLEVIEECMELKRQGRAKAVVVTGCMATSHRKLLEEQFPEVDSFLGLEDEAAITETLERLAPGKKPGKPWQALQAALSSVPPRLILTPSHTAYLRVSDGCSRGCSFCVIPRIRGPHRSRAMKDIIAEAEALAAAGVKELNLIAQDTTAYGLDQERRRLLPGLLHRLNAVEGVRWIRVLYAYPTEVSDELLQVMAEAEKVVPYLDLPLQHASPGVLRTMRRPDRPEHLGRLIERIRRAIPDISLRTAFIVGFPGESETDFERLLNFCREMAFDHVGAFVYSPEEGSPAAELPDRVLPEVQQKRYERLVETVNTISEQKVAGKVGGETEVLVDGESDIFPDFWRARHPGQAPDIDGVVYVPKNLVSTGEFTRCRLTASQGYDLFAEPL